MLRLIADKCTWILLKNHVIQDNMRGIYIYGFELFWSTFLCVASILSLGILFGYWRSAFVFLLFFMPIRMVAGGYHAKSYGACFVLTNGIAIICVFIAKRLWQMDELWISFSLGGMMLVSLIYIWRMGPVNLGKFSTDKVRVQKNRKYSHFVIICELMFVFIMNILNNSYVSYTAILATCAVAVMINVAKREEVK